MKYRDKQIVFFTIFIIMLLFTVYNDSLGGAIVAGFCILMGIMIIIFPNAKVDDEYDYQEIKFESNCLTYYGDELNFTKADIISVLSKYHAYYNELNAIDKQKFISRLEEFIVDKTFKIHNCNGFREMPILISATAIQVSFGLQKYLLPHFIYINIHPVEFIGLHPTIRFLEGNVSGNSINISWKYFLAGFQFPQDGKNVGLHEMAHAYHYQNFGPCDIKDKHFINTFNKFNEFGNKVYTNIQHINSGLYSNYAKRNFQEFWAESVELFFEKSLEFRITYPEVYQSVCDLLHQDPIKLPEWSGNPRQT